MANVTTYDFHGVTVTGGGPNFNYEVTGAIDDEVINWSESGAAGDDDGQWQIGEDYNEPGFGAAIYLGQIEINGQLHHLFNQGGFHFITADIADPIPVANGTTFTTNDLAIINAAHCFGPGTQIATPDGSRAVETLEIGDTILTHDHREVPVKWVGRQRVVNRFGLGERRAPVRIAAGALGGGLPDADLTVSADHGIVLDGTVINASAMVNGTTISFVPVAELADDFTYYHIETEAHEAVLANGAAAETFVDIPDRKAFDNYAEYVELYGVERIVPEMKAPRITSQRLLPEALRHRLGIATQSIDMAETLLRA